MHVCCRACKGAAGSINHIAEQEPERPWKSLEPGQHSGWGLRACLEPSPKYGLGSTSASMMCWYLSGPDTCPASAAEATARGRMLLTYFWDTSLRCWAKERRASSLDRRPADLV